MDPQGVFDEHSVIVTIVAVGNDDDDSKCGALGLDAMILLGLLLLTLRCRRSA